MNIQLSEHFTFKKLFHFTLPSVIMLIFTSIYGVIDGYFVSNYAEKTAFAAVNFIMPFLMILGCFGFMFGTGGGALISKTLGEGDNKKANKIFSLIIYVSIACGIILAILGIIFIRPFAELLGAEGQLLDDCVSYGRIILLAIPAYILQYEFQCLFATSGKPQLGLYVTAIAGLTNIILDALLVAVFHFGLEGAAVATAIGQCVGGIIPIIYFARPNSSLLKLGKTSFDGKALLRTCTNGVSELMSNISLSVISMLYNVQLMKYAGEDGVAAYGVLMYVGMIFNAIFIGYSVGIAPVISFNYGANNKIELKNLFKKSCIIIIAFSVCMFAAAELLAEPLAKIYVGYDDGLMSLTLHAFTIFSFSFLFAGLVFFGSSLFTALNNGFISAAISFLRAFVFQIAAVLVFPLLWGIDGIWLSIVAAELMASTVSLVFILTNKKRYGY